MKTISDYTIYCTPEQTKKALELGASIKPKIELFTPNLNNTPHCHTYIDGEDVILFIPTAEQLIGWLEEQGILIETSAGTAKWYGYAHNRMRYINRGGYSSRKEATLAAIDAALEYLSSNKI